MKILLFGSGGFIGKSVSEVLRASGHEVVDTYRDAGERPGYSVDLLDTEAVGDVLEKVQPEVVVNCAGIVQNNEAAEANPRHTDNIISQVLARHISLRRLVVLGSAAEYGVVEPDEIPVNEDVPLRAIAPYGRSKADEVAIALKHRSESGLPIVVARVFNPLGKGMPERQLVPRLLGQIDEIRQGDRTEIEISRIDAERDYVDVRDLAGAVALLATGTPQHAIYNIGSGKKTTNGELVRLLVEQSSLSPMPPIKETSEQPEPRFAPQADITRMTTDFGWQPETPLEITVKDIVDDTKQR